MTPKEKQLWALIANELRSTAIQIEAYIASDETPIARVETMLNAKLTMLQEAIKDEQSIPSRGDE